MASVAGETGLASFVPSFRAKDCASMSAMELTSIVRASPVSSS